jgi:hypothetical protein
MRRSNIRIMSVLVADLLKPVLCHLHGPDIEVQVRRCHLFEPIGYAPVLVAPLVRLVDFLSGLGDIVHHVAQDALNFLTLHEISLL